MAISRTLCKSAAFFALFRSPASRFRNFSVGETGMSDRMSRCPDVPPKTGLLSISTCQRPYEEEIGRPNAAKYYLTFSDEKRRFLGRIIPSFWAILPLWYRVRGNPGPIRARIVGAGPWPLGWPVLSRRAASPRYGRPGGRKEGKGAKKWKD